MVKLGEIKKINFTMPKIQTASGTFESNKKTEKIEEFADEVKETEIFKQDNMIQNKILNGGIEINGFNSLAYTIIPYEYAKKTGSNLTSVSQLLPNQIKTAKLMQNIKEAPIAKKTISAVNNVYTNSVKSANQFYNAGNFASTQAAFGEKAFAQLVEQTGAKMATPSSILKAATAVPNIAGAAFGGAIDTIETSKHYYSEGGIDEIGKHKGELGGRFIGSTAGAFIGTTAATIITAATSGAATGATVGAVAGSLVPVAGNVVGAAAGCVIGAIASTFLGDLGAEIGTELLD